MDITGVAIGRALSPRADLPVRCPEGEGTTPAGPATSVLGSASRCHRRGIVKASVVIGLLGLVGCGSSSSTSSSAGAAATTSSRASQTSAQATSQPAQSSTGGVCGLATQSEVDAAAGVSLSPPAPGAAANQGSAKCSWMVPGQPATGLVVQGITVAVIKLPPGVAVTNLPFLNGKANGKPIAGLGDAAASLSPGQLGPGSVHASPGGTSARRTRPGS